MAIDNLAVEPVAQTPTPTDSEQPKPTEAAVTEVVDQVPPEGSENLGKPTDIVEESIAADDDETVQVLELDGKEHTLDELRTHRDGHMMQKDYTKKTQALAEERTTFKAESESSREALSKDQAEVAELKDQLTVLVGEDEQIDWVELKEKDLETYVELKEKADKRKEALEKIKADRNVPADDPATIATEQGKLFAAMPDWIDSDNKITETYTNDIALMNKYMNSVGYEPEEYSKINRAHHHITILEAAKYRELMEKGRKIKAQRDKVHVVTKPKAKKSDDQSTTVTAAQAFFPNVK